MTREQVKKLEADLWDAADNLRANSDLKSSEYAIPVAGPAIMPDDPKTCVEL